MMLEFYGGAGCVTGSCHILRINKLNILLDCGMFQGKDGLNGQNNKFIFNPKEINYVILSHAHIDHSGRIPYLYKKGFRGKIITTNATKDLCEAMLKNAANIQKFECERKNRVKRENNKKEFEPLYSIEDVENSIKLFKGYNYNENIKLKDDITIILKDAGHLLGSAIIELIINEHGVKKKIIYSGDLGNKARPLIKDPAEIYSADYLIMESTYGDENHKEGNYFEQLVELIKDTINRKGNTIIPCFSIGRTQEILYVLNKYVETGEIKCRVFVDSPLAKEVTEIFKKNEFIFDEDAKELLSVGDDPLEFKNLVFTNSVEESKLINTYKEPCIIISSSGMCDAGRIKYHLLNNIENYKNSIVFVGYQCNGTLGREIIDNHSEVNILGNVKNVKAQIHNLNGLSGHADKNSILSWVNKFREKPHKIILVHGEEHARKSLANALEEKELNVMLPLPCDIINL